MHSPRIALVASLLIACVAAQQEPQPPTPSARPAPQRPPNLVLLLADDAGWADFGFQPGCAADARVLTPRIDSIAADGARFPSAYVSGAVCSPSRAGLQTGRYQQRFGHEKNIPAGYMAGGMALEERTIGDRLAALDYDTALVGKWHLGYPAEYHPNRRGYELFYGLLQGSRSYLPMAKPTPHKVIQRNGTPLPEGGHVTARLGDAATQFVREHREQPFVLMVCFTATHGPLEPAEGDLAVVPEAIRKQRRNNLGLLVGLDRAVGAVLDAIDAAGLRDDTLVVFSNDNGGQTQTGADNGQLRGRKGMVYEGGVRVPMAMRWPGVIGKGGVIDDPVILLDVLPTFVAAAGGTVDPAWHIDGVDLLPRLRGTSPRLAERPLFWRTAGSKGPVAMRRGRYKLVHLRGQEGAAPQLFDLDRDLGETTDLAAAEPERLAAMLAELAAWERQLVEPRW
ncbi:MAG: sulfatase-like hydrolase/transferase [Planctomycetes bacterium]|nr:sulfatase-like hydrolase/transferase [Planctomycetota bacterium]